MPRSVNHVASKARRKKILKLTRGLADLAMNHPEAFKAIVAKAKAA
ncbi:hypothetical protein [Bacteroides sp.]|nr:hypothetical protein [Bacteroides sp.]